MAVSAHNPAEIGRSRWGVPLAIVLFLGLIAATIFLYEYTQRYAVIDSQFLLGTERHAEWTIDLDGAGNSIAIGETGPGEGVLEIINTDAGERPNARIALPIPAGAAAIRFSAEVRSDALQQGQKGWHTARIVVYRHADDRKFGWDYPHVLTALEAPGGWTAVERMFDFPPDVPKALVVVEVNRAVGHLAVRNLQAEMMKEQPYFRLARYGLIIAWIAAYAACVVYTVRAIRSGGFAIVIVTIFTTIILLTLVSGADRARMVNQVMGAVDAVSDMLMPQAEKKRGEARRVEPAEDGGALLPSFGPAPQEAGADSTATADGNRGADDASGGAEAIATNGGSSAPADGGSLPELGTFSFDAGEVAHGLLFMVLSLLVFLAPSPVSLTRRLALIFLFAGATEAIQVFAVERSPSLFDLGFNVLGALAALVVYGAIRLVRPSLPDEARVT